LEHEDAHLESTHGDEERVPNLSSVYILIKSQGVMSETLHADYVCIRLGPNNSKARERFKNS